jgi:hypothetical protein
LSVSINALSVGLPTRQKSICNPVVVGPSADQLAGELRAIVSEQVSRCAALVNEPIQHLDNVLALQSLTFSSLNPYSFFNLELSAELPAACSHSASAMTAIGILE